MNKTTVERVLEAARRHIRSFEPGTLIGSELNLACELAALDGEIWQPWIVSGEDEPETRDKQNDKAARKVMN